MQQQAKQQGIVLPSNIQQNITSGTLTQSGLTQNVQHGGAPGLSPINQNVPQFPDQNQQQLQLRQYRLHQLQLQREQAQKNHLVQQQQSKKQIAILDIFLYYGMVNCSDPIYFEYLQLTNS